MYTLVWGPPHVFEWSNYPLAWTVGNVGLTLYNTFVLTAASVILILVLCYFAAYAQARIKFPGSNVIMVVLVGTMLFPSQVIIIPLYTLEASLRILNTRLGLILPYVSRRNPVLHISPDRISENHSVRARGVCVRRRLSALNDHPQHHPAPFKTRACNDHRLSVVQRLESILSPARSFAEPVPADGDPWAHGVQPTVGND